MIRQMRNRKKKNHFRKATNQWLLTSTGRTLFKGLFAVSCKIGCNSINTLSNEYAQLGSPAAYLTGDPLS